MQQIKSVEQPQNIEVTTPNLNEHTPIETKNNNHSKFIYLLIFIILVLLGIIVVSFAKYQNLQSQLNNNPIQDTTLDSQPTENVETMNSYSNDSFSFNYPKSWTIKKNEFVPENESISIINSENTVGISINKGLPGFGVGGPTNPVNSTEINIKVNDEKYTTEELRLTDDSIGLVIIDLKNGYSVIFGSHTIIPGVSNSSYNEYMENKKVILEILESLHFSNQTTMQKDNTLLTYTDPDNVYSFQYPEDFELGNYFSTESPAINNRIVWNMTENKMSECEGGCPVIELQKDLVINNYNVTMYEGYVGEIGGNIPQSFINYEIKNPVTSEYFSIYLWELEQTKEVFSKESSDRKIGEISQKDKDDLLEIVNTFKFL